MGFGLNACVRLTRTGSILISVDPVKQDNTNAGAPSGAAIGGDVILIASASLWSMVMVRQSKHAPHFSPVTLATIKVSHTASCPSAHPAPVTRLRVKVLWRGLCVVVCQSKHAMHDVWLVGAMACLIRRMLPIMPIASSFICLLYLPTFWACKLFHFAGRCRGA